MTANNIVMDIARVLNPNSTVTDRTDNQTPVMGITLPAIAMAFGPFAQYSGYACMHQTSRRIILFNSYSVEQIDFIRYLREDCNFEWRDVCRYYNSHYRNERATASEYRRRLKLDSRVPTVQYTDDSNNEPALLLAEDGDAVWAEAEETLQGMLAPSKLVHRHPERAQGYYWVKPEHRQKAGSLRMEDRMASRTNCPVAMDWKARVERHWRHFIYYAELEEQRHESINRQRQLAANGYP